MIGSPISAMSTKHAVVDTLQSHPCLAKDVKERRCLGGNPRNIKLVVVNLHYFAIFQLYFFYFNCFCGDGQKTRGFKACPRLERGMPDASCSLETTGSRACPRVDGSSFGHLLEAMIRRPCSARRAHALLPLR